MNVLAHFYRKYIAKPLLLRLPFVVVRKALRLSRSVIGAMEANERLRAEIAHHQTAESLLRESEARFRVLVEQAPDAITVYDMDLGHFIEVNAQAEMLYGCSREELLKSGPERFYPAGRFNGRTAAENVQEMLERALAGERVSFQGTIRNAQGRILFCDLRLARLPSVNRRLIRGSFTDISAHKHNEAALKNSHVILRNILETTQDGYWRADAQGHLLDVNPAYCKLSGYMEKELLGMRVSDLEVVKSVADIVAHIQHVPQSGGDQFESRHRRKDGSIWDVEVSATYSKSAGGQFFMFLRDITARKHAEAELSKALNAAKLADRSKDEFLANITHELRTPLNAVIGMTGLAQGITTDPRQRDYLDKIVTSGKHLNRIINDLLDLSKIAAGHMEFEALVFSLRALLRECSAMMAHRVAEKGLKLVESIDDDVPDVFRGDALRLNQILLNLLGNAIKFTPKGRIDIRVGLQTQDPNRVCIFIEVADTGIGMKPEDLDRLFKPFSQADGTVSRKFGGTGLGLVISKRLAEMMDGDIKVSSREGVGTTFRLSVWLERGDVSKLLASVPVEDQALPAHYQNVHVLVAEDQPLNREIVEALLAAVGIVPRMAENGQEALDILNASGPGAFDLVLMDLQMPIMDGLAATRVLRRRAGFESLPVIAVTAHTMAHEQEISLTAGMNDHIGKPFNNANFYRTLAKWIPRGKQTIAPAPDSSCATPESCAGAGDALSTLRDIDVAAALERFSGNETSYRRWLTEFVATAGEIPGQMRSDIDAGRADRAGKTAHALKGRVGMLGMRELHGMVSVLESALLDGAPVDEQLSRVEHSIGIMRDQLARVLDVGAADRASNQRAPEKVVWNDAYSVGVAELDGQHLKLVEMINLLVDCQVAPSVKHGGTFYEVLSRMFDYTQVHFKAEEDYLQGIGYPRLAAHEEEHAEFVKKMVTYSLKALDGQMDMAGAYQYLRDWLLSHILQSDMQYRYFVEGADRSTSRPGLPGSAGARKMHL